MGRPEAETESGPVTISDARRCARGLPIAGDSIAGRTRLRSLGRAPGAVNALALRKVVIASPMRRGGPGVGHAPYFPLDRHTPDLMRGSLATAPRLKRELISLAPAWDLRARKSRKTGSDRARRPSRVARLRRPRTPSRGSRLRPPRRRTRLPGRSGFRSPGKVAVSP